MMKNQWKWVSDQAKKMWNELGKSKSPRFDDHKEVTMNIKWNYIAGQWARFHEETKERWSKLTDADITAVNGRFEALTQKIQEKYGIEKDEAKTQIDLWTANLNV